MLKDDQLVALADDYNVAQFVSFGPGDEPRVRHSRIRGEPQLPVDAEGAVRSFLRIVPSCNIRTFQPSSARGTPFHYQLTRPAEVVSLLKMYAHQGYYTIINETVDVDDGGVSGVALGGILEFAPKDTPRAVEKPGIMGVEHSLGVQILTSVYSFNPEIPHDPAQRIEFSIHPNRVGYRRSHTLLWQLDSVGQVALSADLKWPNRFSCFIGDKAFGLLVASCLGSTVPRTTVVCRNVAPFSFGRATSTGERWIRTCPPVPVPGKFTTESKWRDPFALLQHEDPAGDLISSVVSQHGVEAKFSGASFPMPGDFYEVQGVSGRGDLFMQGRSEPEVLPPHIVDDVRLAARRLHGYLGPVSIEWVHDGEEAWVLQVHISEPQAEPGVLSGGVASRWVNFDPTDGLEILRDLVRKAEVTGEGIIVTRRVGVTSHVGEILRASGVPARFASEPDRDVAE